MSDVIYWCGRAVAMRPGETIAAALLRAGILDLAGGRHFCGIGQCQNCIVAVAGGGPVEACLTLAVPDMRLSPLLPEETHVARG